MNAVLHVALATTDWGYPLTPAPAELVVAALFSAAVYFVVQKWVVPWFEANYAARVEAIEGGILKAEAAQAEAAVALKAYQEQLADSRAEASKIRHEAQAEGAAIIAELRAQAQAQAERITTAAQLQVEAERQQALVQLRVEVGRLATDLASRIVGESLENEVRQSGVVERFLAELEGSATVGQGV